MLGNTWAFVQINTVNNEYIHDTAVRENLLLEIIM